MVTNTKKGIFMKMKALTATALFCLTLLISNYAAAAKEEAKEGLESKKDKLSYSIGVSMAGGLIPIKEEINLNQVLKGIGDQFYEKDLLVSENEARTILGEFSIKMQKKMAKENEITSQKNLAEGNNFLKENQEKEGVTTTESGLQYLVLTQGDGPKPTSTDKVKVHYKGTTIAGVEFDSSYKRGEPIVFPVTGVIKGWTEALQLMNVGSKYKLFIPSELAYGPRGSGPAIGPNSVLIFEVELLGIEK